jgi:arginine:ornithine antiporter / lysine permease
MVDTPERRLSRGALIALVIGSMIGSGIFALPAKFGHATGVFGALLAWVIAGTGMLMLAFVFQTLSLRKPELDAGVYAYAKAGFGNFLGFASAFGYWVGCCLADVACLVLIKSTLGAFFPIFGDGTTFSALVGASLILWLVHILILRGVKEAAALNTIATIAKMVPLFIFIGFVIYGFKADVFALNLWGGEVPSARSLFSQVRGTMLLTVFVFVGIEGASVYSRYAKDRKDVGLATVLGFLSVLSLLVLVTILSYGILLRPDLAALRTPSMAGIMAAIVGPWGAVFISVGLLISILGNYLSWSLLAAEVIYSAARNQTMPKFLARQNKNASPVAALWASNLVIQAFLILTPFAEYAFTLTLKMTSVMTLVPYLLVAAYGLRLAWQGETYEGAPTARRVDFVQAGIATVYAAGMIYAGGFRLLLLSAILYCAGSVLFVMARREQRQAVFSGVEWPIMGAIIIAAAIGVCALIRGSLAI